MSQLASRNNVKEGLVGRKGKGDSAEEGSVSLKGVLSRIG